MTILQPPRPGTPSSDTRSPQERKGRTREKTDVLVIGGSAAGIIAATTAKSFHPDKTVTLVRKERSVQVLCGIPYVFGTLEGCGENRIPDAAVTDAGVVLEEAEITSVNRERKICTAADGREFQFAKLVFATGPLPKQPTWLPGADRDGVYVVPNDREYLEQVVERLERADDVVVIGVGFIGVEVADELRGPARMSPWSRRFPTCSVSRSTPSSLRGLRRSSGPRASRSGSGRRSSVSREATASTALC